MVGLGSPCPGILPEGGADEAKVSDSHSFPPGSPTDLAARLLAARLLAARLTQSLGQRFVVENSVGAGASGNVAGRRFGWR